MMASLTDLPMEMKSRCSLGSRSLRTAVDDSWGDLQTLTVGFAAPPLNVGHRQLQSTDTDDSRTTGVHGTMTENGERSSFSQRIRSSELLAFLKRVSRRLSSLTLKTEYHDPTAVYGRDQHQIGGVLAACADTNIVPSVVVVVVDSWFLLSDRSLLESVIRWSDVPNSIADDVPFWHSLTLTPGRRWLNTVRRKEDAIIERLRLKFGPPPNDVRLPPPFLGDSDPNILLHEMEIASELNLQSATVDELAARWRTAITNIELWKWREMGCTGNPNDGGYWHIPLLQMLIDSCQQLKRLDVDDILELLNLRPSALHYPKTLTELVCRPLGEVNGEITALVANCPLLEVISVNCSSLTSADTNSLTKLDRLKTLELKEMTTPSAFTLGAFGVIHSSQLDAAGTKCPWPMLQSISLSSRSPQIATVICALVHGCPLLQDFTLSLGYVTAGDIAGCLSVMTLAFEQLCCQPHLRRLKLELGLLAVMSNIKELFDDRCVDNLAANCPNLEQLSVNGCQVSPLSLSRLLCVCPSLRSLSLDIGVYLGSPDVHLMLRSVAADAEHRNHRLQINVRAIFTNSYESFVRRIVVGLPPAVRLCLSDVDDVCLHGVRSCWRCCFDEDRSKCRSLVIGHSRRLDAVVVWTCPLPRYPFTITTS